MNEICSQIFWRILFPFNCGENARENDTMQREAYSQRIETWAARVKIETQPSQ